MFSRENKVRVRENKINLHHKQLMSYASRTFISNLYQAYQLYQYQRLGMYVIIKNECMIQIVHTLQDIPLKREIVRGHTNQN